MNELTIGTVFNILGINKVTYCVIGYHGHYMLSEVVDPISFAPKRNLTTLPATYLTQYSSKLSEMVEGRLDSSAYKVMDKYAVHARKLSILKSHNISYEEFDKCLT